MIMRQLPMPSSVAPIWSQVRTSQTTDPLPSTKAASREIEESCELSGVAAQPDTNKSALQERVDPLAYWTTHKVAQDPVLTANALEFEKRWQQKLGPGEGRCVVGIQVDPAWVKKNPQTGQTFVYLDELADAVVQAGGIPKLIFPGRGDLEEQRQGISCLLNSGGNDIDPSFWGDAPVPGTDKVLNAFRLANTKWALDNEVPFLGICLGNQELAVAAGGKLERIANLPNQHISHWNDESAKNRQLRYRADHGLAAAVDSSVARHLGPLAAVNSIHNWAVSSACPGPLMSVVAWGMEENPTPEALTRVGNRTQNGVQFHPEFMRWANPQHDGFFQDLVRDGATYARLHNTPLPHNPHFASVGQEGGFFLMP